MADPDEHDGSDSSSSSCAEITAVVESAGGTSRHATGDDFDSSSSSCAEVTAVVDRARGNASHASSDLADAAGSSAESTMSHLEPDNRHDDDDPFIDCVRRPAKCTACARRARLRGGAMRGVPNMHVQRPAVALRSGGSVHPQLVRPTHALCLTMRRCRIPAPTTSTSRPTVDWTLPERTFCVHHLQRPQTAWRARRPRRHATAAPAMVHITETTTRTILMTVSSTTATATTAPPCLTLSATPRRTRPNSKTTCSTGADFGASDAGLQLTGSSAAVAGHGCFSPRVLVQLSLANLA